MLWLFLGCADPPLLDEVAVAYGNSVVDEGSTAIALFVSVGAIVAEPCAADTLDAYVYSGEANRALRITTPQVDLADDGTHTYSFGTVVFDTDGGDLTLTSDAARHAWTARFGGADGVLTANYSISTCVAGDDGAPATEVTLAGTGTYVLADGTEQDVSITGSGGAVLGWSPSTAPVPTSGQVTWHITDEKHEIALEDAANIVGATRGWPAEVSGSGWSATGAVFLP